MKVMVVTHDAERRTRLTKFLAGRGYEICVPPHRQDVLPIVKKDNPHVIILDLYVADPGAPELAKKARAEGYTGKLVVLAGSSTRDALGASWGAGVDQVVGGVQAADGPLDEARVEQALRDSFQKEIAKRAHELWVQQGRPKGKDHQNWVDAEQEIFAQLGNPAQDSSARSTEQ